MKSPEYGAADLRGAISPWRKRLMLKAAVKWATWGLGAGLGIAVGLMAVARFVPWPDVLMWGAFATVAAATTGLVYSLLRIPSLEAVAREADRLLALSDRLGTAWEFRKSHSTFAVLQRQNALDLAKGRDPAERVRIRPGRSHFLPILVGLVLTGLLLTVPNPMNLVIQQREQFQQQLAHAREEIQKTQEEATRPDSSLSAEERTNLEEALEELKEALSEAETAPEALAALSVAEEKVNLLRDPKAGQDKQLRDVGSSLTASPATQALGQALQSMDEAALVDAIEALADQINSKSDGELQDLAAALQQAANAATGNEALAGSLRQASRAIASGDPETALGELADRLAALQEGVEALGTLEGTQAGLRSARSVITGVALVQAPGGRAVGEEQQEGGGSVSGPGQGGQNGNGEGTGEGGPGGEGSRGLGPGGGSGGSGAGNQPGGRQGDATGRLLTEGETVFVPSHGPGVPTEVRARPGQGVAPGRLRPYNEVLGEYAEQAREHMERSPVPQGYKDLVRRYFAELER